MTSESCFCMNYFKKKIRDDSKSFEMCRDYFRVFSRYFQILMVYRGIFIILEICKSILVIL